MSNEHRLIDPRDPPVEHPSLAGRCPMCGGFFGDYGECVTVGCEGFTRERLKIEAVAEDANVLDQLCAAVARIESGVRDIRDGFDELLKSAADDASNVPTIDEHAAIEAVRLAAPSPFVSAFASVVVRKSHLDLVLRFIDRVQVRP